MSFFTSVQEAVDLFKTIQDKKPIRVISNQDTDGITAASILLSALKRKHFTGVITFVKQVSEDYLATLAHEDYATYFFLDIGSGSLDILIKMLPRKNIFVFDHHYPDSFATALSTMVHLNPHLHDLDGTKTIAAAGITYLFVKTLDERNKDLAHLAVIGAIGDMQEHHGFTGLNADILQDALESNSIAVKQDLRLFGIHTKPLHKFLEYTTNPYMPQVTGNEKGALQFLQHIGIHPKVGSTYKWLADLSAQDVQHFLTTLTAKQHHTSSPASFLGPVYLLPQEPKTSPTRDAVEFSTLINACGKMGKPSLGVGVCLGDAKLREKAILLLRHYHTEIIACLNWFYQNKKSDYVQEFENYVVINAENFVRDGLIGTLVSMISKSNVYPDGTVLIGLAAMLSDEIKVSTRICGFKESLIDLRKIIKAALKKTGGQGGGHRLAAGATLPAGKGQDFLKHCTASLTDALVEAGA